MRWLLSAKTEEERKMSEENQNHPVIENIHQAPVGEDRPVPPTFSPEDHLNVPSRIERIVLARWYERADQAVRPPNQDEGLFLERLKLTQRVLLFYAHWHFSSFEEVPSDEILEYVAKRVNFWMGEGLEYLTHAMDTWSYRHEFHMISLGAMQVEYGKHPKSVKLDCNPPIVPASQKAKRQPGAELQNGINGIVIVHRATWGGAPGGYIQGRADQFGKRLVAYATWFIAERDKEPSLYHLGKVARVMEKRGYSSLGREVGEKEFRLLLKACKESADHS
jgi:hypothetical protein